MQKLLNESACHFSGKVAQAKLGLKMRSQVQLGNENGLRVRSTHRIWFRLPAIDVA
jgi:hypothetical protein